MTFIQWYQVICMVLIGQMFAGFVKACIGLVLPQFELYLLTYFDLRPWKLSEREKSVSGSQSDANSSKKLSKRLNNIFGRGKRKKYHQIGRDHYRRSAIFTLNLVVLLLLPIRFAVELARLPLEPCIGACKRKWPPLERRGLCSPPSTEDEEEAESDGEYEDEDDYFDDYPPPKTSRGHAEERTPCTERENADNRSKSSKTDNPSRSSKTKTSTDRTTDACRALEKSELHREKSYASAPALTPGNPRSSGLQHTCPFPRNGTNVADFAGTAAMNESGGLRGPGSECEPEVSRTIPTATGVESPIVEEAASSPLPLSRSAQPLVETPKPLSLTFNVDDVHDCRRVSAVVKKTAVQTEKKTTIQAEWIPIPSQRTTRAKPTLSLSFDIDGDGKLKRPQTKPLRADSISSGLRKGGGMSAARHLVQSMHCRGSPFLPSRKGCTVVADDSHHRMMLSGQQWDHKTLIDNLDAVECGQFVNDFHHPVRHDEECYSLGGLSDSVAVDGVYQWDTQTEELEGQGNAGGGVTGLQKPELKTMHCRTDDRMSQADVSPVELEYPEEVCTGNEAEDQLDASTRSVASQTEPPWSNRLDSTESENVRWCPLSSKSSDTCARTSGFSLSLGQTEPDEVPTQTGFMALLGSIHGPEAWSAALEEPIAISANGLPTESQPSPSSQQSPFSSQLANSALPLVRLPVTLPTFSEGTVPINRVEKGLTVRKRSGTGVRRLPKSTEQTSMFGLEGTLRTKRSGKPLPSRTKPARKPQHPRWQQQAGILCNDDVIANLMVETDRTSRPRLRVTSPSRSNAEASSTDTTCTKTDGSTQTIPKQRKHAEAAAAKAIPETDADDGSLPPVVTETASGYVGTSDYVSNPQYAPCPGPSPSPCPSPCPGPCPGPASAPATASATGAVRRSHSFPGRGSLFDEGSARARSEPSFLHEPCVEEIPEELAKFLHLLKWTKEYYSTRVSSDYIPPSSLGRGKKPSGVTFSTERLAGEERMDNLEPSEFHGRKSPRASGFSETNRLDYRAPTCSSSRDRLQGKDIFLQEKAALLPPEVRNLIERPLLENVGVLPEPPYQPPSIEELRYLKETTRPPLGPEVRPEIVRCRSQSSISYSCRDAPLPPQLCRASSQLPRSPSPPPLVPLPIPKLSQTNAPAPSPRMTARTIPRPSPRDSSVRYMPSLRPRNQWTPPENHGQDHPPNQQWQPITSDVNDPWLVMMRERYNSALRRLYSGVAGPADTQWMSQINPGTYEYELMRYARYMESLRTSPQTWFSDMQPQVCSQPCGFGLAVGEQPSTFVPCPVNIGQPSSPNFLSGTSAIDQTSVGSWTSMPDPMGHSPGLSSDTIIGADQFGPDIIYGTDGLYSPQANASLWAGNQGYPCTPSPTSPGASSYDYSHSYLSPSFSRGNLSGGAQSAHSAHHCGLTASPSPPGSNYHVPPSLATHDSSGRVFTTPSTLKVPSRSAHFDRSPHPCSQRNEPQVNHDHHQHYLATTPPRPATPTPPRTVNAGRLLSASRPRPHSSNAAFDSTNPPSYRRTAYSALIQANELVNKFQATSILPTYTENYKDRHRAEMLVMRHRFGPAGAGAAAGKPDASSVFSDPSRHATATQSPLSTYLPVSSRFTDGPPCRADNKVKTDEDTDGRQNDWRQDSSVPLSGTVALEHLNLSPLLRNQLEIAGSFSPGHRIRGESPRRLRFRHRLGLRKSSETDLPGKPCRSLVKSFKREACRKSTTVHAKEANGRTSSVNLWSKLLDFKSNPLKVKFRFQCEKRLSYHVILRDPDSNNGGSASATNFSDEQ